jgi:putative PIN family toxin of toxin-antitoxin system
VLRVTPDVQALVQAAISGKGAAGVLIASWERRETIIVTCEEIVASYEEVLSRPHITRRFRHISSESIAASGEALRKRSVFVQVGDVPGAVLTDPDDDVILACAVKGNADYIVSRDRHLLELGTHRGIPIVTPETFAAILRGQVSEEFRNYFASLDLILNRREAHDALEAGLAAWKKGNLVPHERVARRESRLKR